LDYLLKHPAATALFLYPTKALIEDQLTKVRALSHSFAGINTAVYDGDTSQDARSQLRKFGRLLLSNP